MKTIYVIGAGIEGQEGFSRRALELVSQADMLIGGARQLALFPDFCRQDPDHGGQSRPGG